jgi:D-glycero-alpha-D-manno-heptose 1-phosphate guanylyltransferase
MSLISHKTDENPGAPFKRFGREAIILAGGLGTRLRTVVSDLPKCMAPVAGRPFLFYVINFLQSQGVEKFIFSLGYKHEAIEEFLHDRFSTIPYQIVLEEEPLGTGGAARLACSKATEKNVLLANGDTMFKVNVDALISFHTEKKSSCTLSLKPMSDFDRYGVVELNDDSTIKDFNEKRYYKKGLINGGLYAINVDHFLKEDFPEKFSFEKYYLEKKYKEQKMYGVVQNEYFIDIGIPEDFNRAQTEFKQALLSIKKTDKSWTLFLDRDGVINEDKPGSYILNPGEFHFYNGVLDAFKKFGEKFGRIIIVTNQRGIGKGMMTEDDLTAIHEKMKAAIKKTGASIDAIYYCTSTSNTAFERKPNPGMALRAKNDFPEIDFNKSIMVGNNISDVLFGKNAGMYTVFVKTTNPGQLFPHPDTDLDFNTLPDFAKAL